NVGKSTLLNRLSGRERAIVSHLPGTTRDVLEVDFEVHGIPVRLLDTAGVRESDDVVEQEGVRRAKVAAQTADLTLFIADISDISTWQTADADICVMNKCDLAATDSSDNAQKVPDNFLQISADNGSGVDVLLARMAELLGEIPSAEEGLLVTSKRHRQQLLNTKEHLLHGRALLGDAAKLDLVALEWRQAWSCLGEILGIGDVEYILDRIFSEFCIGK
ncbi:MAG: GTP-binding protein, partial [Mariprofundaceae bacterium]|nr:GTP-binding protein [Mariprofundaceae bacterium]